MSTTAFSNAHGTNQTMDNKTKISITVITGVESPDSTEGFDEAGTTEYPQ